MEMVVFNNYNCYLDPLGEARGKAQKSRHSYFIYCRVDHVCVDWICR